jgi:aryl-alcohol dehydrogenase-like predicted oxidoreductase
MKHTTLGSLDVSRIGLGAMGMSGVYGGELNDAESISTIHRALDLGLTLIDTAEVYGPYTNEELVGKAIKDRRDEVVLATKFGFMSHVDGGGMGSLDSRPENIRLAVEGSLKRLNTDYIDLYYQHRIDPKVPIEEVVGTLSELIDAGKIRHIGLSEAWVDNIRRAHATHPITALQSEFSLWTRDPQEEVMPLLQELGIGFVPYSPLGRGFLTGAIRSIDDLPENDSRRNNPRFSGENFERNLALADEVKAIAEEVEATPAQVAIAWILSHGDHIAPIPGTRRVARLEENLAADDLVLSDSQIERLTKLPAPSGGHHTDEQTKWLDRG